MAINEAKSRYMRLRDDCTLGDYDVLQEYPHTFEWRQTYMDRINSILN